MVTATGIGLCAQHGGAAFGPFCGEAVQTLVHVIGQPNARKPQLESGTDNAAASLGKVAQFQATVLTSGVGMSPQDLFSSWLAYLPLRSDVQESILVNKQLVELVGMNHAPVLGANNANLPRIMSIFAEVLETELVDEEVTQKIQSIIRNAQAAAPVVLENACRAIAAEGVAKLQACCVCALRILALRCVAFRTRRHDMAKVLLDRLLLTCM